MIKGHNKREPSTNYDEWLQFNMIGFRLYASNNMLYHLLYTRKKRSKINETIGNVTET